MTRDDAALGAVLGALCGDAAGAVLEFFGTTIGPADVAAALAMPGGGPLRVAPGQITDDGELTLCQLRSLAAHGTFDLDALAAWYDRWVSSSPFDIGTTTIRSLGCLSSPHFRELKASTGCAAAMTAAAAEFCQESKANGSLMRSVPLGIWGHALPTCELANHARAESSLSHPNPSCRDAVACYAIAIAHLVAEPGDVVGAHARVVSWVAAHACNEVREWLSLAEAGALVPYSPRIGFVKIAFVHAFRHMIAGTAYVDALRETLLGGGDTDTNACIVGGLVGAAHGVQAVPETMRTALLTSSHDRGSNPRPDFLHPRDVPDLVARLLHPNP